MVSVKSLLNLSEAFKGLKAAWEESEHPRVDSGPGGGQFTASGGGTDTGSTMTEERPQTSVMPKQAIESQGGGLTGEESEAFGPDPSSDKTYHFRYKLMDLDDLVTSHNPDLTLNPRYPKELQPRIRDRAASRAQIEGLKHNSEVS